MKYKLPFLYTARGLFNYCTTDTTPLDTILATQKLRKIISVLGQSKFISIPDIPRSLDAAASHTDTNLQIL